MTGTVSSIIVFGLLCYLLFLLFLFLGQDSMLYIPGDRTLRMKPSDIGLKYEDVRLETADNVVIHGWLMTVDKPKGVVIFCHGNAGNISHRVDNLRLFAELGFSVLIFDYRGYGQSSGKPTEAGTYLDGEAVYDYLVEVKEIKPEKIVVFGRSMGAAIATYIASKRKCGGLIIESAFTSVPDIGQQLYPFLPVRLLSRYSYDSKARLKTIHCPVLVAHSPNDEIIPFSHGEQLFQVANQPKSFLTMKGGHNDGYYTTGKYYFDELDKFLTETLE